MAQTRSEFVENIRVAMVDNSRYPDIAGEPMPQQMQDEMEDSMARLANPIWDMVASWALGLEGDEFPDERVRMSIDDPLTGFLGDKIDDDTIKYDEETFKLYVNNIPIASSTQVGGITIGIQDYLYMQDSDLILNVETSPLLNGGNSMIPTSRAVKVFVGNVLNEVLSPGGAGDMLKSVYDSNDNGVVDDSELLNGQLPSYYLDYGNFTGTFTIDDLNESTPGVGVTIEGVRHQDWRIYLKEITEPTSVSADEIALWAEPDTLGINTNSVLKYKDENGNVERITHKRYVHVQGASSSTWIINHNLGLEPNIEVYDNSAPPNKLLAPVTHNSLNQSQISMGVSVSGKAICLI